jgi:hypothetical protein
VPVDFFVPDHPHLKKNPHDQEHLHTKTHLWGVHRQSYVLFESRPYAEDPEEQDGKNDGHRRKQQELEHCLQIPFHFIDVGILRLF